MKTQTLNLNSEINSAPTSNVVATIHSSIDSRKGLIDFHPMERIVKLKEGMRPMGSLKKTRSMIPRKTNLLVD